MNKASETEDSYENVLRKAFTKHYHEGSDVWTLDLSMRAFPSLIQGYLKLKPETSFLDVGCGIGYDCEYFASICGSVTGIDLYEHEHWKTLRSLHSKMEFHKDSLFSFSTEKRFDVVLDNGCFHHQLPSMRAMYLKRIFQLLKSNGHFAISTFKNENIDEYTDVNGRLHTYFKDEELLALVSEAGFHLAYSSDIYRLKTKDYYRLWILNKQ